MLIQPQMTTTARELYPSMLVPHSLDSISYEGAGPRALGSSSILFQMLYQGPWTSWDMNWHSRGLPASRVVAYDLMGMFLSHMSMPLLPSGYGIVCVLKSTLLKTSDLPQCFVQFYISDLGVLPTMS